MNTLSEYFETGNEFTSELKTTLDIKSVNHLAEMIEQYFEHYWYSDFRIKIYDKDQELRYIELRSDGFESVVQLYYEQDFVTNVQNVLDATAEIEKLILSIV